LAIAATIVTSSILGTGRAQASPLSYVQVLNDRGIVVYDVSLTIANGYAICDRLSYETGADTAVWVFTNTSWADVPTIGVAAIFVITAAEELCPQHDHRGEVGA